MIFLHVTELAKLFKQINLVQNILTITVFSGTLHEATRLLIDQMTIKKTDESLCISCTGAHGVVEASENANFKQVLKNFYLNLPDGMPLVWMARLRGFKNAERCYGPDVFAELLAKSLPHKLSHFFCGGKPGVAEELREIVTKRWKGVEVAGTFCPPFRPLSQDELTELAKMINNSGASFVWVGLGTPKQEIFAAALAPLLHGKLIITIGAAFDFYTGKVRQAPKWVQHIGMEWFFRLLQEPKRLAPRYLKIVPKFAFIAIKSLITERSKKIVE